MRWFKFSLMMLPLFGACTNTPVKIDAPQKAFCHYDHIERQFNCSDGTWSPRYHCLNYPGNNGLIWTCLNVGIFTPNTQPSTCDASQDALAIIDIMRTRVPQNLGMNFEDLVAMLQESISYCSNPNHINPKE